MTTDEMVAGLREAHEQMTPGPWTPGRPDMLSYDGDGRGPWKQIYWDDPAAEMHMGEKLKGIVGRMVARPVADACGSAWLRNHASAVADELAMLAEEVKHLKPLVESTLGENSRLRAALLNLCAKSFEAYAYIGPEPKPRDQYDQYDRIAAPAWEAAMAALGEEVRQWMSKARG